MTDDELRKLAVRQRDSICPWCKNHEPHEVYGCVYRQTELELGQHGDAVVRLLDEHARMKAALETMLTPVGRHTDDTEPFQTLARKTLESLSKEKL